MSIHAFKIHLLASLLLGFILFTTTMVIAEDAKPLDIAEFHQILSSINQANIPDNVKEQLFRDMKTSMIENVRNATIPEDIKRVLIKDLESTTRE